MLLNKELEEKIESINNEKEEAVRCQNFEKAAKVRDEQRKLKEELTFRAPALRQKRHKKSEPQLAESKTRRV